MSNWDMIVFDSSYYILFCCLLSLRSLFSHERQKENRSGGEGMQGRTGMRRGTILGIDCMKKESMSNKQEKWENEGKESSESLGKKFLGCS